MTGEAKVLRAEEWLEPGRGWNGRIDGIRVGAPFSVILFSTETIGGGTPLHFHPYEVLVLIQRGEAEMTVGTRRETLATGDAVRMAANTVHDCTNLGPGGLDLLTIHFSDTFARTEI